MAEKKGREKPCRDGQHRTKKGLFSKKKKRKRGGEGGKPYSTQKCSSRREGGRSTFNEEEKKKRLRSIHRGGGIGGKSLSARIQREGKKGTGGLRLLKERTSPGNRCEKRKGGSCKRAILFARNRKEVAAVLPLGGGKKKSLLRCRTPVEKRKKTGQKIVS